MTSAMIYKELRETAGIAAVAVVVLLLIITGQVGMSPISLFNSGGRTVPFLSAEMRQMFIFLAAAFTIAIGFRQTAWELWQGTFLFLLHRPVSRRRMILTKMGIGLAVYLLATAIPFLLYAAWASMPGTHASPFEWSMTYLTWKLWITMSVLYLGAVASGLIEGRWLGRRLLPLATAGALAAAIASLPWWWCAGFPLLVIAYSVYIVVILWIADSRDYA